MDVTLRPFDDADLDQLFAWEQVPEAVAMAAFTRADPSDRAAFDEHYRRVRSEPANILLAIVADGAFVGTVSSFTIDDEREVSYWIDSAQWGRGIASRALAAFLADVETTRPLFGRVAAHNDRSATVLERAGFVQIGTETSYADGLGREVLEHIYRLDPSDGPGNRLDDEAAWTAALHDGLAATGGELSAQERAWADAILHPQTDAVDETA